MQSSDNHTWPTFFPQGCPSEAALPACGKVYRLIKGKTPTSDDFLSHRQMDKNQTIDSDPTLMCRKCAISVITCEDDLGITKRVPRFKDYSVAAGVLDEKLGVIMHTPSRKNQSHHDWWVPQDITTAQICSIFSVLPTSKSLIS